MANFIQTAGGLPGLKALSPETLEGLAERALAEVAAAHRWPFLLVAQESKTWAANDSVQGFHGVARLISIMAPDSNGDYYRLKELSDIEFQKFIELNPDHTDMSVWRDAGMDGDKFQIEMYKAPSSAKTLKMDYVKLPTFAEVDSLPARLQMLVMNRMMVYAGSKGSVDWAYDLQRAVAQEMDLQGKRDRVGRDAIQASRWRNINNPS
jgi:hypothetical protein